MTEKKKPAGDPPTWFAVAFVGLIALALCGGFALLWRLVDG